MLVPDVNANISEGLPFTEYGILNDIDVVAAGDSNTVLAWVYQNIPLYCYVTASVIAGHDSTAAFAGPPASYLVPYNLDRATHSTVRFINIKRVFRMASSQYILTFVVIDSVTVAGYLVKLNHLPPGEGPLHIFKAIFQDTYLLAFIRVNASSNICKVTIDNRNTFAITNVYATAF